MEFSVRTVMSASSKYRRIYNLPKAEGGFVLPLPKGVIIHNEDHAAYPPTGTFFNRSYLGDPYTVIIRERDEPHEIEYVWVYAFRRSHVEEFFEDNEYHEMLYTFPGFHTAAMR